MNTWCFFYWVPLNSQIAGRNHVTEVTFAIKSMTIFKSIPQKYFYTFQFSNLPFFMHSFPRQFNQKFISFLRTIHPPNRQYCFSVKDLIAKERVKCPYPKRKQIDCMHDARTKKDKELEWIRAQTEGTCKPRYIERPQLPDCPHTRLPSCPPLGRAHCDVQVAVIKCMKRISPYKSYSECRETMLREHIHQCDICPTTKLKLPISTRKHLRCKA